MIYTPPNVPLLNTSTFGVTFLVQNIAFQPLTTYGSSAFEMWLVPLGKNIFDWKYIELKIETLMYKTTKKY